MLPWSDWASTARGGSPKRSVTRPWSVWASTREARSPDPRMGPGSDGARTSSQPGAGRALVRVAHAAPLAAEDGAAPGDDQPLALGRHVVLGRAQAVGDAGPHGDAAAPVDVDHPHRPGRVVDLDRRDGRRVDGGGLGGALVG